MNHQRIHLDQARNRFSPARLDAENVDFSDRISNKPKSYHVRQSRRRRPRQYGSRGNDDTTASSGEEDETLAKRIARLKREVEEVQAELASASATKEPSKNKTTSAEDERKSISNLSSILSSLQLPSRAAHATLQPQATQQPAPADPTPTSTQTHTDTARILSKATALESRLARLEAILGTASTHLPTSSLHTPRPMLTHLSTLEAQMHTLTATTVPSLESMRAQIDALSTSTARLAEARSAASSAQAALLAAQTSRSPDLEAMLQEARAATAAVDDPALVAQVEALYAALPTVEALAPLLPATVARLRSLRGLHADAAEVRGRLVEVEKRQAGVDGEIGRWKEGLERVEAAIRSGEGIMEGNREVVEGWVRELEARVERMVGD